MNQNPDAPQGNTPLETAPQEPISQEPPQQTPPPQQNAYYAAPVNPEASLPPQYKPIRAWGYVGYQLLFSIPIVGLICMIVFACSSDNINRRNFARSFFCTIIIGLIIVGVTFLILFLTGVLSQISLFNPATVRSFA